jgi:GNAT superfamily N-acetyltransferase
VEIGPMKSEEIAEVSALLRACFHWLADGEGFNEVQRAYLTGERSSEQTVRDEAVGRPHLVARRDGVILGMAAVNGNELARLYIHPRFHRQGVGRALFEAAENLIRQVGHRDMIVGALVESAAKFYQAMGMHVTSSVEYQPAIFPDRKVILLSKYLD